MASILRSSRLVYSFIGFSRQTGNLTSKKKKILLKDCRGTFNFNELRIRTTAVAAQRQVQQENSFSCERLIYQLSLDLRRQRVSRSDFENAFEAIKQKGELKYSHLMLLLKCCSEVSFTRSEEDRVKMAKSIWKVAQEFGIEFKISHYNALLEVFVINHHKFSPTEFLDSLKNAGLEANFETYRLLLRAYCSQGDIEGAGLVLNLMKKLDLPLNRTDFNSLIQGYCEIGNLEKAAEILQVMEERKIKPYSDSYVYLLCGYAKHGRIDKLEEMLNQLPEKNIILLDSELLEIIYTLAINDHDQHVDVLLEKIVKEKGYIKTVTKYIVRLFEKRKDSLALKLYKTIIDATDTNSNIPLSAKCILDFFAAYREPKEILDICGKLVDKENIENAIHYALNACYQVRDENFYVSFLDAMKAQGIKVKRHYYWPAIIQASKKGNSELFSILNRTSSANLLKDHDTLRNIVLRNFTFGNDWKVTFENFIKIGANVELLTKYLIEMFLVQKKLDEVEFLISSYPVRVNNLTLFLQKLFKSIGNQSNENERVVNILYYLAHDLKNEKFEADEMQKKDQSMDKKINIFDKAVQILLSFSFNEEVSQDILQKMLAKKMRLNSFSIDQSNQSIKINEIINKLTDPNLEFEWDSNIIEKKNNFTSKKSNLMNEEMFFDEESFKAWTQKFDFASLDNFVSFILRLADQKHFEEAIKIGQHLSVLGKEVKNVKRTRPLYKKFLSKCIQNNEEPMLLEKAFDLGIKLGILQMRDFSTVIRSYLRSKNPSLAVEKFCDHALCSGELSGCIELLRELITLGKTEDIDKITNFVTKLTSKEISYSFLFAALASAGEVDKANELLKNEKIELDRNIIRRTCAIWSKTENSTFFEKILEILKDFKNLDRQLLYKILLQKYIEENRLDAIKELSLQMEQDSFLNDKFRDEMAQFIKNPNIEAFSQFFNTSNKISPTTPTSKSNKKKLFWHFIEKQDYDQAYSLVLSNEVPSFLAAVLLDSFASQGKVSEVLDLLNKPTLERYIKRVAAEFLKAGKINEYFLFLNHFVAEGKINRFSDFFKIHNLLPSLKKDDVFLQKYKSFALQCLEEANVLMPLISYFVECVKIPDKLKEAENVLEEYNDHFKKVTLEDISDIAESTEKSDFYENLLSSEKLKTHFSENLSEFYNKIISVKLKANKLDCAIRYLEMAEADGVKEHLDKDLTTLLNKKVTKSGNNTSENSKTTPD